MYYPNEFKWIRGETPLSNIYELYIILGIYMFLFSSPRIFAYKNSKIVNLLSPIHNIILVLMSIIMFIPLTYYTIVDYLDSGILICESTEQNNKVTEGQLAFWIYIFYLSKFYELFDTMLLVLRGKTITWLHYLHHTSVILVFWLSLDSGWLHVPSHIGIFNSFVHIIMYTYFFLTDLGYRPIWKKYLTTLQISQFVYGLTYIPILLYYIRIEDFNIIHQCKGSWMAPIFTCIVNVGNLILFLNFYSSTFKNKTE